MRPCDCQHVGERACAPRPHRDAGATRRGENQPRPLVLRGPTLQRPLSSPVCKWGIRGPGSLAGSLLSLPWLRWKADGLVSSTKRMDCPVAILSQKAWSVRSPFSGHLAMVGVTLAGRGSSADSSAPYPPICGTHEPLKLTTGPGAVCMCHPWPPDSGCDT